MDSLKSSVLKILTLPACLGESGKKEIILLTPAGFVSGKVSCVGCEEVKKVPKEELSNFINKKVSELDSCWQDGYLLLSDVTVRSLSGNKIHFATMVVFYDQIIAATLGALD